MSSTCFQSYYHCVFGTKRREQFIATDIQPHLYAYMGGIAKNHKIVPIAIGGMPDHVHLLLQMPSTLLVPRAMNLIKGSSSKWMNECYGNQFWFDWQDGYGAFTIGHSQVNRTVAYIRNQEEHHGKFTFEYEYMKFLKKNGVEYDPKYLWD